MTPLAAMAIVAAAVTAWITHDGGRSALVVSSSPPLPKGEAPMYVTTGAGSVWVLTTTVIQDKRPSDTGTLLRVNPKTASVVAVIPLTGGPTQITVDDSFAWVSLFNASAVAKIDLTTNKIAATIPLELPKAVCSNSCPDAFAFLPVSIAASQGAVWVSTARGYVAHIDAADNRVLALIPTEADQTGSITIVNGTILVSQGDRAIARVDPSTDAITHIDNPANAAHGFGGQGSVGELFSSQTHPELGVWMSAGVVGGRSGVVGIDPSSGETIGTEVGTGVRLRGVTDRVWVQANGQMFPVSIRADAAGSGPRLSIPDTATVAIDESSVWWITPDSGELTRTELIGPHAVTRIRIVDSLPGYPSDCSFLRYLPFELTYLPGEAPLPDQPLPLGYHPANWAFPGGEIEMWRGADIPQPDEPTQSVTVLGHEGRIGAISDGYSVVFNLGDPNDTCTQWALVSHPGTTLEQTRAIAAGLIPAN